MKLDTQIEGQEENCRVQKNITLSELLPFLIFAIEACPEHISESIEGN